MDYNKKGIINGKIDLSDNLTFYVKYGDYILDFHYFSFLIIFIFLSKKKKY